MNLEDHLGDIVRKARMMSGTSAASAAGAAGLSEAELGELEDSGSTSKRANISALAQAIGLSPAKLERIAGGWLPAQPDVSRWRHFRAITSSGDGLTVNSYLIWDEATRVAALFDTGFDARQILDAVMAERLLLRDIFITHSHHDHIAVLADIRVAVPQARIHSHSPRVPPEQRLKPAATFQVGDLQVSARETPGHAADGVTYLIQGWPSAAPAVAVVGDTIFAGSMGRGNDGWELARTKVREHILSLPAATLICPGHGPLTTVGEELENNPFF